MTGEWILTVDDGLFLVVVTLLLLLIILAAVQHDLTYHTVRIYNWDGKRYRFLGRERLHKKNDTYVVNMCEGKGDASFTTIYLLLASAKFVRKRRYGNLLFRAGKNEVWMPVEERMRVEALYVYR